MDFIYLGTYADVDFFYCGGEVYKCMWGNWSLFGGYDYFTRTGIGRELLGRRRSR